MVGRVDTKLRFEEKTFFFTQIEGKKFDSTVFACHEFGGNSGWELEEIKDRKFNFNSYLTVQHGFDELIQVKCIAAPMKMLICKFER